MRISIPVALLIVCIPTAGRAQPTVVPSAADDSAVYSALVTPPRAAERGRAVKIPIDLHRMPDASAVGLSLAGKAKGFDASLVAALHRASLIGRGPGVALAQRPALLWRETARDSVRDRTPPNVDDGSMEYVERDPQRIPLTYSVVQYSRDKAWALVFESMWCGPLCGKARYVVLRRASAGQWQFVAEHVVSVS